MLDLRDRLVRHVPAIDVDGVTESKPVAPTAKRGRGRPAFVGTRVVVGLSADLLADIDREAAERGTTRAAEIRRRLRGA